LYVSTGPLVYLTHLAGHFLLATLSHGTCLTQWATYTRSVERVMSVVMKSIFSYNGDTIGTPSVSV